MIADNTQTLMATMLTYSTTATTVKLSILFLYRRLFITRMFRLVTLFVGALCILWFIIGNMVDIFQCHPIGAAFDARLIFTHQCIDIQALYWGFISTNMVRSSRISQDILDSALVVCVTTNFWQEMVPYPGYDPSLTICFGEPLSRS